MNYNEQIIKIKKIIQNKEYSVAEEKLLSLIESATTKNIEDANNTHYSFNNYIETLLFWNTYRPEKKNIDPDINYAQVYYYLGFINIEQKNYGKALEYLQKGLQWNPLDVTLIFEVAAIYRMTGNIERFKAEIEKAHPFIYDSSYMAKYYRELGWYYVEKRVFDLANALYTQSIGFFDTEIARNELGFIAKQENREPRFSTKEEIKKLFTDYNIWSGFNRNTINLIYEEFKRLQAVKPQPAIVRYLSQRLYDITLDKNFMTYYELKDNEHGVKIRVPETWKYLEKSSYEKANIAPNTTFFLMTPVTLTVNIVCDGKCSNEQLDEAFKVNIENMKKNGTEVEKQYSTEGNLRNRQAFIKVKQNDKVIRLFQVYKVVNGYLFCISWQVTNEDVNLDQLLTNVLNSFAMGVVNSFEPINSNETKAEDIAEQVTNVLNNAKEVDFTIQNINEEYTKNKISEKLIKMLHIFSDTVISEDKQDPFWTETAKNVLEIILLTNLITRNSISSKELKEQIKDYNMIKTNIKENIEKLSIPELNEIMSSKSIIDSEKPFKSVMDIIKKSLLPNDTTIQKTVNEEAPTKPTNTEKASYNLKEFSQEIPDYPTFKFYFPEEMGEYSKTNSNVFELKKEKTQKIRVMISKCSSKENLEADAKKWIEKNKNDAKMEDVSYRKEKIKDIPIEVYELKYINRDDLAHKIYKIGYVNGCRITISGSKLKGREEIINTAFEKITWEEPSTPKKENFFESLENSLKIAYTEYENNKISEATKELENILEELLKDDKQTQENMISKMFVYDVFKAIIFNSFYNKKQITNNDLDSLLANKELVKKNVIEFCENFKEQKDIISQAESLSDNMLKNINDKTIEDVLHTIMMNIGKKNIKIKIKTVDKKPIENKPIIIDCPVCKTNFELKWNVPATEKTFYCRCPNCNTEIKRGNPNYKGN